MPIRPRWEHFEFPKRLYLPVLKDKPDGDDWPGFGNVKTVTTRTEKPWKRWYFCPACEGWIEGGPHEHRVNTLDGSRLAGRKGTEFYCLRCAKQIAFEGVMS